MDKSWSYQIAEPSVPDLSPVGTIAEYNASSATPVGAIAEPSALESTLVGASAEASASESSTVVPMGHCVCVVDMVVRAPDPDFLMGRTRSRGPVPTKPCRIRICSATSGS